MNSHLDWTHLFNYALSILVKLHCFMDTTMFDNVTMVTAMVS